MILSESWVEGSRLLQLVQHLFCWRNRVPPYPAFLPPKEIDTLLLTHLSESLLIFSTKFGLMTWTKRLCCLLIFSGFKKLNERLRLKHYSNRVCCVFHGWAWSQILLAVPSKAYLCIRTKPNFWLILQVCVCVCVSCYILFVCCYSFLTKALK